MLNSADEIDATSKHWTKVISVGTPGSREALFVMLVEVMHRVKMIVVLDIVGTDTEDLRLRAHVATFTPGKEPDIVALAVKRNVLAGFHVAEEVIAIF